MPIAAPPYDPVYDAIKGFLEDGTEGWDPSIAALVFENTTNGPPDGSVAPWVLILIESQIYGQESIGGGEEAGGNRWDETGRIWFHVFTPINTDSREARRIAKALVKMFRGKQMLSDRLTFGDADMSAGDPGAENGNYYLLSAGLDWFLTEAD